MKQTILVLLLALIFSACETGTRYDKNATKATTRGVPTPVVHRGGVNEDIENLLRDRDGENGDEALVEPVAQRSYIERDRQEEVIPKRFQEEKFEEDFNSGRASDGLNVKKIRVGQHEGYTRLVFDIYEGNQKSQKVGTYHAKYHPSRDDISVLLEGYNAFSAKFPRFSRTSVIETMYLERYEDNRAFKFHIKLRQEVKIRTFSMKNPARLVVDIKPI